MHRSWCKSWLVEANRFEAAPGVNAGIWGAVGSVTSKNAFVLQSFAVFKPFKKGSSTGSDLAAIAFPGL